MSPERAIIVDLRSLPRLSRLDNLVKNKQVLVLKMKDKIIKKSDKLYHSSSI
jgi:hypothetical protein